METFVEKVMYNLVLYALTIGEITLTQSLYIESHIHSGLQPTIVLQQWSGQMSELLIPLRPACLSEKDYPLLPP